MSYKGLTQCLKKSTTMRHIIHKEQQTKVGKSSPFSVYELYLLKTADKNVGEVIQELTDTNVEQFIVTTLGSHQVFQRNTRSRKSCQNSPTQFLEMDGMQQSGFRIHEVGRSVWRETTRTSIDAETRVTAVQSPTRRSVIHKNIYC